MRHDIHLDGHAFRLRPITDADAQFVLALRCDPELTRYLHSTPPSLSDQLTWLAQYYARDGDYYFVVERKRDAKPEGLIAIYDVDETARAGEWGRWILRPGSLAAAESVLLIYRCGFELLDLKSLYCRTVADNVKVVSFHDACGIKRRRELPKFFELHGTKYDAIEHALDRTLWPEVAPKLELPARAVARRMERG